MKKTKVLLVMLLIFSMLLGPNMHPTISKAANTETPMENSYITNLLKDYKYQNYNYEKSINGITWTGNVWKKSGSTSGGYITNLHAVSVSNENAVKEITIPSKFGDLVVVEIGDGANDILFDELGSKVKSVTIPKSIISIDDNAFKGYASLEEVKYEDVSAIQYIGKQSFQNCDSLESITYYGNIAYGSYVYSECNGLKKVDIESATGKSVTVVDHAFYNCLNLEELSYSDDINFLTVGESCFESCNLKKLTFDVPLDAGYHSFAKNGYLEQVTFNDYVRLGEQAFSECFFEKSGIEKSVNFNGKASVHIGINCFMDSTGLKNIEFSDNITYLIVNGYAFQYTGVEDLEFNGSYAEFSENALNGATKVKSLRFNSTNSTRFSGTLIEMPFGVNHDLNSVTIRSAAVYMNGIGTFWGFQGLKQVIFEKSVSTIYGEATHAFGSVEEVYLKNPKVYVNFNDQTDSSYTVYGFNHETKDNKTGMYGWKKGSNNENIVCKNIQKGLGASYIGTETLVEGQSLDTNKMLLSSELNDGTLLINGAVNGMVYTDIPYSRNDDKYAGFVLSYGQDNKLQAGVNKVFVYYGDAYDSFDVVAEKKKVTEFTLAYVGEPKIEGQTVSKEDFKVTNVAYNDNEVVEEVFDFEVTGIDTSLTKGKNIFKISYDGLTKEYELDVAEKKLKELEIKRKENDTRKYVGDIVSADDFLVTAIYDNGDKIENFIGFTIKDTKLVEEKTELEFIAGDIHVPYIYHAIPVVATNVQVSVNEGATAIEHGEVDKSLLTVTAGLNNGQKIEVPVTDYEFEAYDIVAGKVNTITVKYKDLTTTFNITGIPASICALEVMSVQNLTAETPAKTYYIGDVITKNDIEVTAVYNNGLKERNYKDYTITKGTLNDNVNTITISLNSNPKITAECEFLADDVVLDRIEVEYKGKDIPEGQSINKELLTVKAYYSNGAIKELVDESYTIKEYFIVDGVKTTIVVEYNGKEDAFEVKGTPAIEVDPTVEPTATPAIEPTATPAVEPTATPTVEPTATPTVEPTATPTVEPTATPLPQKVVAANTAVTKATATPVPAKKQTFTWKSNNKSIKLQKTSAKTTYKIYTNKTIKLTPSVTDGDVYYQIVKSGKKVGKNWKKVNKQITIKNTTKACVYIKYTLNGKTVTKKTKGFILDKNKPKISVANSGKLKVTDKDSGIKSIKDGKKKVKNGAILKKGVHKITAVDKAGNKKTVKVTIK